MARGTCDILSTGKGQKVKIMSRDVGRSVDLVAGKGQFPSDSLCCLCELRSEYEYHQLNARV